MSRPTTSAMTQDCDGYSLFGESEGPSASTTSARQQRQNDDHDGRLPRITVVSRAEPRVPSRPRTRENTVVLISGASDASRAHPRHTSDESEPPFSGGICRQLAAMYTDVGMTTVERVRWLCGWMVLVYALTCCAWFAWPAYAVPVVGILTGIAGLSACQRPHDPSYLPYVTAFLVLNYAQIVLLVWILAVSLSGELSGDCVGKCAGVGAKVVFIVLLVLATGAFHWKVVQLTRQYVREFRMIEQLAMRGTQFYPFEASSSHGGSTVATDVQSSSSVSDASVSNAVYAIPIVRAISVSPQSSRVSRV